MVGLLVTRVTGQPTTGRIETSFGFQVDLGHGYSILVKFLSKFVILYPFSIFASADRFATTEDPSDIVY